MTKRNGNKETVAELATEREVGQLLKNGIGSAVEKKNVVVVLAKDSQGPAPVNGNGASPHRSTTAPPQRPQARMAASTSAPQAPRTPFSAQWCPVCGEKKRLETTVCYVCHKAWSTAAQRHHSCFAALSLQKRVATKLAGKLSPSLGPDLSELAWARSQIDLKKFGREFDEAKKLNYLFVQDVTRLLETLTNGEIFDSGEEYDAAWDICREKISGSKEAYFQMLPLQRRQAAAAELVTRCDKEGIKPVVFLTEPLALESSKPNIDETSASEPEIPAVDALSAAGITKEEVEYAPPAIDLEPEAEAVAEA